MLYILATPIGNLKDISLRAIDILESCQFILCEDTRNTGMLLKNLGIKNNSKLISFYDEIEDQKNPEVVKLLKEGNEIALVSDAGTPLISDPGYKLVKKCRSIGVNITSIPGPSALVNALILSGLPCGRFSYLGFLPKKDGDRKKILENYRNIDGAKIVYESPFRVKKLLEEIKNVYGDEVQVAMCREMTKKFEEVVNGNVNEVITKLSKKEIKGEVVVIIA